MSLPTQYRRLVSAAQLLRFWTAVAVAVLAALTGAPMPLAQTEAAPAPDRARLAGHYRIDVWEKLGRQKIEMRFLLKSDGAFELGAEWPYHETSRFSGTWSVSGERVVLQGEGEVWTNQGAWRTPFARSYRISGTGEAIVLTPQPEKNRYGLLGWPNPFERFAGARSEGGAGTP